MSGESTVDGLLLGIDLGTTLCKCVVSDSSLNILGEASRPIPLIVGSDGQVEQDARQWWSACTEALSEILGHPGIDGGLVRGIGISAQGISFVPVDAGCQPLGMAYSWMDLRAKAEIQAIRSTWGEEAIFRQTGKRCNAAYTLPKLLWLKHHDPELYHRAAKFLMPMDFIVAMLTGECVTDHTMASGTMFYDLRQNTWSGAILDTFDLDPEKLPRIGWSGQSVGRIRPDIARSLGISPGAIVALGGQDQKVAALGAGIGMDRTSVSLGTAMAILRQYESPVFDPGMRIPCFADLGKDRWVIEGSSDCCSILDWMRAKLFAGQSLDELNAAVERIGGESNPVTVLPFFSGAGSPHYAPATGIIHGLGYATTAAHLVRGFYEGIACLIRSNLEVMEELSGSVSGSGPHRGRPQELRIFGGGSRSAPWCRIIADMTGQSVSALSTSEAASVGALILAGRGCGLIAEDEDHRDFAPVRMTYAPRTDYAARCEVVYQRYCSIRDREIGIPG